MDDFLKGTNLYLVGMMGAGKSTLGKILAHDLGYRFADTDAVIEQAAGQPISAIFAQDGESAFRALETEVLGQLASYTRMAIATGGGIVIERKNWSYLQHGVVVWLDVSVDLLYDRLKGDQTRPLLQAPDPKQVLQTLLNQRRSLYAQADVTISVTEPQAPEAIAAQVLDRIRAILRPPHSTAE
ncbi:MAG TPA: shikimate kinase [Candidatus Obscuribacterales bacterium]